jgi:PPM family protein phosphatase
MRVIFVEKHYLLPLRVMRQELPLQNIEQPEHLFGKGFESDSLSNASEKHPTRNEDALLQNSELGLFGVLDGVGGEAGGEIASRLGREQIETIFGRYPKKMTIEQTKEALVSALVEADKKIREYSEDNPELSGMGSTASVVKIWEGEKGERKIVIAHAGDSRVYILRKDGTLLQITEDDSQADARAIKRAHEKLVDEKIPYSELEAEERHAFDYRNAISKWVGMENLEPRLYSRDVEEGEKVLITSDGIHDNLTDKEITEILGEPGKSNNERVQNLIGAALERSRLSRKVQPAAKQDDMSAVFLEIQRQAKEGIPREFRVGEKISGGWKISSINKEKGTATIIPSHIENTIDSPISKEVPLKELEKIRP